jgi:hypothetical protein
MTVKTRQSKATNTAEANTNDGIKQVVQAPSYTDPLERFCFHLNMCTISDCVCQNMLQTHMIYESASATGTAPPVTHWVNIMKQYHHTQLWQQIINVPLDNNRYP